MLYFPGAARDFPARQKNAALAGQAFQADIGAQTGDAPVEPPAGVRLAQGDDIVQLQVGKHARIIPVSEQAPVCLPTWSE